MTHLSSKRMREFLKSVAFADPIVEIDRGKRLQINALASLYQRFQEFG